jgi:hypothetical protein
MLIIAATLMFLYGVIELYRFGYWLNSERKTKDELNNDLKTIINPRKIERDGFIYIAPTQSEDFENDRFEWGVERHRVGGEGLTKDENFGKTTNNNTYNLDDDGV